MGRSSPPVWSRSTSVGASLMQSQLLWYLLSSLASSQASACPSDAGDATACTLCWAQSIKMQRLGL